MSGDLGGGVDDKGKFFKWVCICGFMARRNDNSIIVSFGYGALVTATKKRIKIEYGVFRLIKDGSIKRERFNDLLLALEEEIKKCIRT